MSTGIRGGFSNRRAPLSRSGLVLFALALLAVGFAESAYAKKYVNAQLWRPSPHSQDLFQVEGARINIGTLGTRPGRKMDEIFVANDWSGTAYVMYNAAGNPLDPSMNLLGTLDILGSVSFLGRVSLGIDLPLHLHRAGDGELLPNGTLGEPLPGFTVGDLRTSLKVAIVRPREYGLGIAISFDFTVPTGGDYGFTAEEGVTLRPRLILEGTNRWVQAALNFAYLKRVTTERYHSVAVEDELQFMFGLGVTLGIPELQFILEADFGSRAVEFFDEGATHLELTGGLRYRMANGIAFQAGGGGGLLRGYGDPAWRFFASFGWQPAINAPEPPKDSDGDGILDHDDECPLEPEDFDGFEDEEGCPDPDNDGDGLCDPWVAAGGLGEKYAQVCRGSDQCPNDAEDVDTFQDEDGCPDPDNDGDGIADRDDGCPVDPEDADGFQDQDGCPDPDNDSDSICDAWVADSGLSAQYAHICRGRDTCPNEPEDFDGCQDEDGCPEPGNICVTEEKLVITDRIYFKTNRATIMPVSFPLLDEIAAILQQHTDILLIEIQGHTDNRGRERHNMKLSDQRAHAVRDYLVKKGGVDPARLQARGYGPSMPIDSNDTEVGRANNRRVEFMILRRAPK